MMSVRYDDLEVSGEKHGLSGDRKQVGLAMAGNVVSALSSSSKISPSEEPNKIGFLNQCKLELSAEVIRWKEENHRLRKEKEACEQKIGELQSVLDKLTRRNAELESNLLSSHRDYEKLKMHSLAINEENKYLHRKLSKSSSKYYSYPWLECGVSTTPLNGSVQLLPEAEDPTPRGWEEVSEKLIQKMKQEMKELQELGQKLALNEIHSAEGKHVLPCSLKDHVCTEQSNDASGIESSIVNVTRDFEMLQRCLRDQHQKLSFLLGQESLPHCKNLDIPVVMLHQSDSSMSSKKEGVASSSIKLGISNSGEPKFVRPSDDSFRAYFTQQLSSSRSTEELKHMMKLYLGDSKGLCNDSSVQDNAVKNIKGIARGPQMLHRANRDEDVQNQCSKSHVCSGDVLLKPASNSNPHVTSKNCSSEEERVCPICEAVFPRVFSQKEFESHVVAHLEAESASLLDQYEIL